MEVEKGREFSEEDYNAGSRVAVVSPKLAEELFLSSRLSAASYGSMASPLKSSAY